MQMQEQQMNLGTSQKFIIQYILYGIGASLYIVPAYFFTQTSGTLFDILNYSSLFLMFFYILKHFKISARRMVLVFIYMFIFTISVLYNNGGFTPIIKNLIRIILPCMVLESLSDDRESFGVLFRVIRDFTMIFFIANIIITVIMPGGIPSISQKEPCFLYGNSNVTIRSIYPGFLASCLLDVERRRPSIWTIVFFIGIFYLSINVYIMATALIATLFLLCWLVFKIFIKNNLFVFIIIIFGILVLFEFEIVILHNKIGLIRTIMDILQKDDSMSGRYYIWDTTIYYIKKKPIFGYGVIPAETLYSMFGNASGSHNYCLDTLIQVGLFGFIAKTVILIAPFLRLYKIKRIGDRTYVLIGFCIGILIMFLTEPFLSYENVYIPIFYFLDIMIERHERLKKI